MSTAVLVDMGAMMIEPLLLGLSAAVLVLCGSWAILLLWARLGSAIDLYDRSTPRHRVALRHRSVRVPVGSDSGKLEPMVAGTACTLSNMMAIGHSANVLRMGNDPYTRLPTRRRPAQRLDPSRFQASPTDTWYVVKRTGDNG